MTSYTLELGSQNHLKEQYVDQWLALSLHSKGVLALML